MKFIGVSTPSGGIELQAAGKNTFGEDLDPRAEPTLLSSRAIANRLANGLFQECCYPQGSSPSREAPWFQHQNALARQPGSSSRASGTVVLPAPGGLQYQARLPKACLSSGSKGSMGAGQAGVWSLKQRPRQAAPVSSFVAVVPASPHMKEDERV